MIRVFIGFDPRETVAFNVLAHSIWQHASAPVAVVPLRLNQLKPHFNRPRNPLQSTDFSFSRFLTPFLADYEGWSIFMDCDMLFRDDIAKLWALRDDSFAVMCCKHNHVPKEEVKFLGATQTSYAKKNWSSLIMFNNAKCQALTPEYVNHSSGLDLHQFKWLGNDDLIGGLPLSWNHLVDVMEYDPKAQNVHFTLGGPYFDEYRDCDYASEWFAARESMLRVVQHEMAV